MVEKIVYDPTRLTKVTSKPLRIKRRFYRVTFPVSRTEMYVLNSSLSRVASVKLPGHSSALYQETIEPAGSNTFRPPNSLGKREIRPKQASTAHFGNVMMVIMALTPTFYDGATAFGWVMASHYSSDLLGPRRPARNERESAKTGRSHLNPAGKLVVPPLRTI